MGVAVDGQGRRRVAGEALRLLHRRPARDQAGDVGVPERVEVEDAAVGVAVLDPGGLEVGPEHLCRVVRNAPQRPAGALPLHPGLEHPGDLDGDGLLLAPAAFAVRGEDDDQWGAIALPLERGAGEAAHLAEAQARPHHEGVKHPTRLIDGREQRLEFPVGEGPADPPHIGPGVVAVEARERVGAESPVPREPGGERPQVGAVVVDRVGAAAGFVPGRENLRGRISADLADAGPPARLDHGLDAGAHLPDVARAALRLRGGEVLAQVLGDGPRGGLLALLVGGCFESMLDAPAAGLGVVSELLRRPFGRESPLGAAHAAPIHPADEVAGLA